MREGRAEMVRDEQMVLDLEDAAARLERTRTLWRAVERAKEQEVVAYATLRAARRARKEAELKMGSHLEADCRPLGPLFERPAQPNGPPPPLPPALLPARTLSPAAGPAEPPRGVTDSDVEACLLAAFHGAADSRDFWAAWRGKEMADDFLRKTLREQMRNGTYDTPWPGYAVKTGPTVVIRDAPFAQTYAPVRGESLLEIAARLLGVTRRSSFLAEVPDRWDRFDEKELLALCERQPDTLLLSRKDGWCRFPVAAHDRDAREAMGVPAGGPWRFPEGQLEWQLKTLLGAGKRVAIMDPVPDSTPGAVQGALFDAAQPDGAALNGPQPAEDAKLSLPPAVEPAAPTPKKKAARKVKGGPPDPQLDNDEHNRIAKILRDTPCRSTLPDDLADWLAAEGPPTGKPPFAIRDWPVETMGDLAQALVHPRLCGRPGYERLFARTVEEARAWYHRACSPLVPLWLQRGIDDAAALQPAVRAEVPLAMCDPSETLEGPADPEASPLAAVGLPAVVVEQLGARGYVSLADLMGRWRMDAMPLAESLELMVGPILARPAAAAIARHLLAGGVRSCEVCGCTEDDCEWCVERTGGPCHWVGPTLCSACAPAPTPPPAEPPPLDFCSLHPPKRAKPERPVSAADALRERDRLAKEGEGTPAPTPPLTAKPDDWRLRPLAGNCPGDLVRLLDRAAVTTFGHLADAVQNGDVGRWTATAAAAGPVAGALRQWYQRNVSPDLPAWLEEGAAAAAAAAAPPKKGRKRK